ncbi:MAG: hypothetical protein M1833_001346 [Piccolia ochrophora]|nr:MAG: hypothetical protein M1833_001346 [Piccolia ochrophora]
MAQHQSPPPTGQPNTTRRDLASWWRRFNTKMKKEEEKEEENQSGIFGVALQDSIKYANVAISLTDAEGKSFIYGYVPIVVAKCGVFLKEKATDVEGIFRLSGSAKRIKDLQTIFNSPDRYGKGLDWTGFTVHDAANILRRYLNNLPEPIIPLEFYDRFRDPLRNHEMQAVGDTEAQAQDIGGFDEDGAIKTYQRLITELPPLSRQLLLYILDLLAVFASKSDLNRMTSGNLAAIFQPGILSHPAHDMAPDEYRLSQDVLVFLIENQDHFLIGMRGTAADENTVKEVQSGGTPQASTPTTPNRPRAPMGRSSSTASAGAESIRRYGGLRRNVSVSSKQSRHSSNAPSPASPGHASSPMGSGVQRSNTVPSKKSPAIQSSRFGKQNESLAQSSTTTSGAGPATQPLGTQDSPAGIAIAETAEDQERSEGARTMQNLPGSVANPSNGGESIPHTTAMSPPSGESVPNQTSTSTDHGGRRGQEQLYLETPSPAFRSHSPSHTPTKERNFSSLFSRSPTSDGERKESRPANKLRKKRIPGAGNESAQSSSHSVNEVGK